MNNSQPIQYTIQEGDTFWDLATQYNTTVEDIMAANPEVDPNNLQVGQVVSIPDPPPAPRPGEHRPPMERRPEFRRPEFRRPEFRRPEFRRPEFRYPEFRRPFFRPPFYRPYFPYPYAPPTACPPGATPYSVQPGESLYSIAARFGISVDAIIATNPYVNFGVPLQIGQVICVPV